MTYTVRELPGQCYAVTDSNEKRWAVCDRRKDAERIAYCLRIVDQSEETDRRTNALYAAFAAAYAADEAFEVAVNAAGYRSRWDAPQRPELMPDDLRKAYVLKIAADKVMGEALRRVSLKPKLIKHSDP